MIAASQFSVDGTAVKLVATSSTPKMVSLHAVNTGALYIGPTSAVTASSGFLIDKAAAIYTVELGPAEELWGITAAGTHTFTVLEQYL